LAEVFFGLLVAPAEQSRDLEVPPAERAVCRSLLIGRVAAQHRFDTVLDFPSILEPLPETERLRELTHVGRHPEVTLGAFGLERRGLASGLDAAFELAPPRRLDGM